MLGDKRNAAIPRLVVLLPNKRPAQSANYVRIPNGKMAALITAPAVSRSSLRRRGVVRRQIDGTFRICD